MEIKSISREAGSRTKIAVWSNDPDVDAVGACVGVNGARVNTIVNELRGEKIDIINWSDNAAMLIENALSPAKVISVIADADEKTAKVVVPDYQLSLAIGKEGQNARLAARLTGFKIDIKSETQAREAGDFMDYENDYEEYDEDFTDGFAEGARDYEEDAYGEEGVRDYEEDAYGEGSIGYTNEDAYGEGTQEPAGDFYGEGAIEPEGDAYEEGEVEAEGGFYGEGTIEPEGDAYGEDGALRNIGNGEEGGENE